MAEGLEDSGPGLTTRERFCFHGRETFTNWQFNKITRKNQARMCRKGKRSPCPPPSKCPRSPAPPQRHRLSDMFAPIALHGYDSAPRGLRRKEGRKNEREREGKP